MKKVVIAFIAGALLMASGQVMAETISKVGKKVGGEAKVILDGQQLSNAIIVDSKSYAPVRDIVEAFDATVSYEKGLITIEPGLDDVTVEKLRSLKAEKTFVEGQIGEVEAAIQNLKTVVIPQHQKAYEEAATDVQKEKKLKEIAAYESVVAEQETNLASLNAKLTEINNQIAELEAAQ